MKRKISIVLVGIFMCFALISAGCSSNNNNEEASASASQAAGSTAAQETNDIATDMEIVPAEGRKVYLDSDKYFYGFTYDENEKLTEQSKEYTYVFYESGATFYTSILDVGVDIEANDTYIDGVIQGMKSQGTFTDFEEVSRGDATISGIAAKRVRFTAAISGAKYTMEFYSLVKDKVSYSFMFMFPEGVNIDDSATEIETLINSVKIFK